MPVDCPFPSVFDMLHIYDKDSRELMTLPLCEVIKGDLESVDNDVVKMRSFETKEIVPYTKNDFIFAIQDAFQKLDVGYVEIILAKDQTKVRI